MIDAAVEWASSPGPPNGVFVLALLSSPWLWSNKVRDRVGPLLDSILPGGKRAGVAETPDEDPRE